MRTLPALIIGWYQIKLERGGSSQKCRGVAGYLEAPRIRCGWVTQEDPSLLADSLRVDRMGRPLSPLEAFRPSLKLGSSRPIQRYCSKRIICAPNDSRVRAKRYRTWIVSGDAERFACNDFRNAVTASSGWAKFQANPNLRHCFKGEGAILGGGENACRLPYTIGFLGRQSPLVLFIGVWSCGIHLKFGLHHPRRGTSLDVDAARAANATSSVCSAAF